MYFRPSLYNIITLLFNSNSAQLSCARIILQYTARAAETRGGVRREGNFKRRRRRRRRCSRVPDIDNIAVDEHENRAIAVFRGGTDRAEVGMVARGESTTVATAAVVTAHTHTHTSV